MPEETLNIRSVTGVTEIVRELEKVQGDIKHLVVMAQYKDGTFDVFHSRIFSRPVVVGFLNIAAYEITNRGKVL